MSPHPMPPTVPSAGATVFVVIVIVFALAACVAAVVMYRRDEAAARTAEREAQASRDESVMDIFLGPVDAPDSETPGRAWCPPSPAPGQAIHYPPRPAGYRGIHRPHNGSPR